MEAAQIAAKVSAKFGDQVLTFDESAIDPVVKISPAVVYEVCKFLKESPELFFDMCHSVSGYDLGEGQELGVIYHLFSFRHKHWFAVKCELPRDTPHLPTVSLLWRTADWHEREIYDLFGVVFDGHPDPRRILCPDDWEGWPLRKDYVVQEYYHGIRVPYDEDWHDFDTFGVNPERGHFVFAFEKKLKVNGKTAENKE